MRTSRPEERWTLEEGQALVAALWEPMKEMGLYVGMTGSTLWRGWSTKDLDIILYPSSTAKPVDPERVRAYLRTLGWRVLLTTEQIQKIWREKGSDDSKHVESWLTKERRRVDLFFLS